MRAALSRQQVLAHGSRKDPRYCVTCHTDQTKYGYAAATFDASGNSRLAPLVP